MCLCVGMFYNILAESRCHHKIGISCLWHHLTGSNKKITFFFKGVELLTLSHYMTLINPDWLSDKRVCRLQGCSQTSFYQITKACFITKINMRGVYNETFKRINEKRVRKKKWRGDQLWRGLSDLRKESFFLFHTHWRFLITALAG